MAGRVALKGSSPEKPKAPWPAVVALPVSLVSVFLASATLYLNYLAPFDPLVTIGGPVFFFGSATPGTQEAAPSQADEFDPVPGRVLGAVLLPVVVTHEGGRPGVVSDIMLRLSRNGQSDRWLFEPRMFVDERAFLTSFEPGAHLKWIQSVFSPIPISKAGQAQRFVMFQGLKNELFPSGRLRLGRYNLEVLLRIAGHIDYQLAESFSVDFGRDVLIGLAPNSYFAPVPESLGPGRATLK